MRLSVGDAAGQAGYREPNGCTGQPNKALAASCDSFACRLVDVHELGHLYDVSPVLRLYWREALSDLLEDLGTVVHQLGSGLYLVQGRTLPMLVGTVMLEQGGDQRIDVLEADPDPSGSLVLPS